MLSVKNELLRIDAGPGRAKNSLVTNIISLLEKSGYTLYDIDAEKPWGAYIRLAGSDVDRFVHDFFPNLDLTAARSNNSDTKLSPKILIVSPGQRLSWQYHFRRSERWNFITDGFYEKSMVDAEPGATHADAGYTIQFSATERHRLIGSDGGYVLVAEIWQHTDPSNPSDENDIVRLQDDYKR